MIYSEQQIESFKQSIIQKFGIETVEDPLNNWTKEKEQKFLKDFGKLLNNIEKNEDNIEKVDDKVFIVKKLINRNNLKKCPVCEHKIKIVEDDIMLTKYQCCYTCYVKYIEDSKERFKEKEQKWLNGWRPKLKNE